MLTDGKNATRAPDALTVSLSMKSKAYAGPKGSKVVEDLRSQFIIIAVLELLLNSFPPLVFHPSCRGRFPIYSRTLFSRAHTCQEAMPRAPELVFPRSDDDDTWGVFKNIPRLTSETQSPVQVSVTTWPLWVRWCRSYVTTGQGV